MRTFFRGLSLFLFLITLNFVLIGAPLLATASGEEAVFAGGCFWCLEHDLEGLSGVISAQSGYSGGELQDPTYEMHEGHQESVLVRFDPSLITYRELLRNYWQNVDPFDDQGQFCDRGNSYRPVIFTRGEYQEKEALSSLDEIAKELFKPVTSIKVDIQPAKKFWAAENYHQDFAERNNIKYNFYRYSCGRDRRLEEIWGKNPRIDD